MAVVIRTTGFADYLDDRAHIKALIMGAPGAGKTRSASFWPRAILLDCERGRMSVADRSLPYIEISSAEDMGDALRHIKLASMKKDRAHDTVIVDTLDAYQRMVIQNHLKKERKIAMSGWQDWGYLDAQMAQFVDLLHNLSMNVVVNLHVKESMEGDEDAGTKQRIYSPKLKGDLRDQIAAEFDFVGLMSTEFVGVGGERIVQREIKWTPEPRYPILKDRSGQLPAATTVTFTENDYEQLLAALVKGMDRLSEGTEVLRISEDRPPEPDPVAPHAGGPVTDGSAAIEAPKATPRKAAAAKPPAADAPAASAPPAAPKPVIDVPVAPKPVVETPAASPVPAPEVAVELESSATTGVVALPEPAGTSEQAVAAAVGGLGAEVLSDTGPVDDSARETEPAAPAEQATEEIAAVPAAVAPPAAVVPAGPTSPTGFNCGDQPPAKVGTFPAAPGCGKSLVDENPERLTITALKAHTYLCPADFAAYKASL